MAFQGIGAAIEQLLVDPPPEHVNPHIETIIGRLLFDERTLFTRLETLRLVCAAPNNATLRRMPCHLCCQCKQHVPDQYVS